MKLRIQTNENGETEVYLGTVLIPGVQHVAFSASVDNPGGQALLIVSPIEVLAVVNSQLVDIETTPVGTNV